MGKLFVKLKGKKMTIFGWIKKKHKLERNPKHIAKKKSLKERD
jgi:hypothetical protein